MRWKKWLFIRAPRNRLPREAGKAKTAIVLYGRGRNLLSDAPRRPIEFDCAGGGRYGELHDSAHAEGRGSIRCHRRRGTPRSEADGGIRELHEGAVAARAQATPASARAARARGIVRA